MSNGLVHTIALRLGLGLGTALALTPALAMDYHQAPVLDAKVADGSLPGEAQIAKTRRLVMVQAHIIAVIPLLAVFLARGYGK